MEFLLVKNEHRVPHKILTIIKLMWKLNLVIEQFYSQQLSIDHAKSLRKETEFGAEQ